jgi:hypothetical protein
MNLTIKVIRKDRNIFQLRKNAKCFVQLDTFCEKGRIPLFQLVDQLNEIFLSAAILRYSIVIIRDKDLQDINLVRPVSL